MANNNNTLFYPPLLSKTNHDRPQNITVNAFDSRYYSGLDVGIYMENIFLEEVIQLQYQVTENRIPYYGYHEYEYHRAACGTRIVQGTFSINFIESFYIYKLLKQINSRTNVKTGATKPNPKTYKTIKQALQTDLTLQDFLSQADANNSPEQRLKALHEIADGLTSALWGEASTSGLVNQSSQPLFNTGVDGFDIYLKFGEPLATPQSLRANLADPRNLGKHISELESYVPTENLTTSPQHSVGSIHKLSGVHITSVGMSVNDSGQPLAENYAFIARGLDESY